MNNDAKLKNDSLVCETKVLLDNGKKKNDENSQQLLAQLENLKNELKEKKNNEVL